MLDVCIVTFVLPVICYIICVILFHDSLRARSSASGTAPAWPVLPSFAPLTLTPTLSLTLTLTLTLQLKREWHDAFIACTSLPPAPPPLMGGRGKRMAQLSAERQQTRLDRAAAEARTVQV
jgi:hypothetical protein